MNYPNIYWGLITMNKVRFRTYWTAQLGLGNSLVGLRNIAQLGLRNFACTTSRIAQLCLRNFQDCATLLATPFQDCATLLAQRVGLRNSACATAFDRLRNSQDCATLLVQLRWPDCATLQLDFLQTIPAPIELENDTCRPQEKNVIKIPTPMELQTDLECPLG